MPSTTTPTVPQTLLEAVNALLDAVRLAPIMSLLTADLNAEAVAAKAALDAVALEVQQEGWWFNRETVTLAYDPGNGHVSLPSNVLEFVPVNASAYTLGLSLIQRGTKVYNRVGSTYAIWSSVEGQILVALPFEELPVQARWYITLRGARRYGIPRSPTQATFKFTEDMEGEARVRMDQADSKVEGKELADTSPHFAQMRKR